MSRTKLAISASVASALLAGTVAAQTSHIYGVHDDSPYPSEWLARCPGGGAWITATDAIGANPSDFSGKAFNAPSGTKILGRLNNAYNPSGTIPAQAQYANFATRVKNFVSASTGCDTWIIGNETNLSVEWPNGVYISPDMYADCYVQCYNAIKSIPGKGSSQKVIVQALAPWAGPYTGQPDNWVDYYYKMLQGITSRGVTPDGLAMHINSRGYGPLATDYTANTRGEAGSLTLDFGWGVHRDWVQFGIPHSLWNIPLYATECNGLNYWQGGGPETGLPYPSYTAGWLQDVYGSLNAWNQNAKNWSMPIYRCANMYRWDNDPWTINGASNKTQILNDLSAVAASNYTWPNFGGNKLTFGTPGGTKITTGITATADSATVDFEAAKAVDNSDATWWASNDTGVSASHWLKVDLGSNRSITGYVVKHAGASGQATSRNTVGFLVEVASGINGPWTTHTMVRTNTPGAVPPNSTSLVYTTPVTARYIRLFINDAANLASNVRGRVTEFEVYQGSAPTPTPSLTPSPTPSPSPTPTPSPTPSPSPSPSPTPDLTNRVVNGSMELGPTTGVRDNWTAWQSSWSNTITYGRASLNKHDGSYSQYWARTADNLRLHGGVYQRVTGLSAGAHYRIIAWMKRQSTATDTWLEFGHDLTGGTAPEASSVTYTKLEGAGDNVWVQYDQTVTATGSAITLFGKAGHYNENGGGSHYYYLDQVSLTLVP